MLKEYPDILKVSEVAAILRIGKNKVYEMLKSNVLGHKRIGRLYLIPKKSLIAFMLSAQYSVCV